MKRRFLIVLISLLAISTCLFGLVSCKMVTFKVDFVVDGTVYSTINTRGQEIIKLPADPEKEGYVFDGWYWDESTWEKPFTAYSLMDSPLSNNVSVYAKWKTSEQSNGTKAEFSEFEKVTETEYSMKVSNSTASVFWVLLLWSIPVARGLCL